MSTIRRASVLLALVLVAGCSAASDVRDSLEDLRRGFALIRKTTTPRPELGSEGVAIVTSLEDAFARHLDELEKRVSR